MLRGRLKKIHSREGGKAVSRVSQIESVIDTCDTFNNQMTLLTAFPAMRLSRILKKSTFVSKPTLNFELSFVRAGLELHFRLSLNEQ